MAEAYNLHRQFSNKIWLIKNGIPTNKLSDYQGVGQVQWQDYYALGAVFTQQGYASAMFRIPTTTDNYKIYMKGRLGLESSCSAVPAGYYRDNYFNINGTVYGGRSYGGNPSTISAIHTFNDWTEAQVVNIGAYGGYGGSSYQVQSGLQYISGYAYYYFLPDFSAYAVKI